MQWSDWRQGEDRRKTGCARDPWPVPAQVRSPRPGTPKPTLPRLYSQAPPPRRGSARPLRPGPPTWPDVGPGPRPRCSAPRRRPAHDARRRAAPPVLPAALPRRHGSRAAAAVGGQAGDASGRGREGREVPRQVRAPLTGPGPHEVPGLGSRRPQARTLTPAW